jgi:hypothetical protein
MLSVTEKPHWEVSWIMYVRVRTLDRTTSKILTRTSTFRMNWRTFADELLDEGPSLETSKFSLYFSGSLILELFEYFKRNPHYPFLNNLIYSLIAFHDFALVLKPNQNSIFFYVKKVPINVPTNFIFRIYL